MPFIVIICIALLLPVLTSYITYRIAFYSPDKKQNDIYALPQGAAYSNIKDTMRGMVSSFNEISYERISIRSFDGLTLSARYYHVADSAPLGICFHGYRSTSVRDFCGGAKLLFEHGCNVIVIDQRAHGSSGGHTICFGIKERYDCLSWIEYAVQRFGKDVRIMLYGISMGGATVLMSTSLPLPKNVVSVLADCPYSSPADIIKKVMRDDMHMPVRLLYPFVYLGARLFGHFKLDEVTAAECVKNAHLPITVIHGDTDSFVPCEMSEQIYNANKVLVSRHLFPGADHGMSYMTDIERYKKIVDEFIKKSVG